MFRRKQKLLNMYLPYNIILHKHSITFLYPAILYLTINK